MIKTERYRVRPGDKVKLGKFDTRADDGLDREQAEKHFEKLIERFQELQELLYADGSRALLIVLQAMDAGGKDSTIRSVFGPLNQQGCNVTSFKGPSSLERSHDFLWRIHAEAPPRGHIRIFNRSHYEDVLIVRVKDLAPRSLWKKRYDHINNFERLLTDEGTVVRKFMLHISKDYQKERLERRLAKPDKHWKFNPDDLTERARWDDYMAAFDDVLERCSTEDAPWYIVPAEKRWFRNLLIAEVLVKTLEDLKLSYPKPTYDANTVVVK